MKLLKIYSSAITFFIAGLTYGQNLPMGDQTTAEEFKAILKTAERATRDFQDLPSAYSLRPFAPPVKDQGELGTCVAWSTAYAARTISFAVKNNFNKSDSIRKYSFSPGHLYSRIKKATDAECKLGASILTAMQKLKEQGNALNSEAVLDCSAPEIKGNEEHYKIKDFVTLTDYGKISKNDIIEAKKSLSEKKPLVVSMKCYTSLKDRTTTSGIWQPLPDEQPVGNHAMCIVGYDDAINNGSFEVMNSWGQGWGNQGYFWLSYEQLMKYGNYLVEMIEEEAGAGQKVSRTSLAGTIEFVKMDGSAMPVTLKNNLTRSIIVEDDEQALFPTYKISETYPGGTAFKVKFTTSVPAYVYIFSKDDKGELSRLFPYSPSISGAINSSNATIYLPSETKHARLSSTPGVENLAVLYSKAPIKFEELLLQLRKSSKSLQEEMQQYFGPRLLPVKDIRFTSDTIGFRAGADEQKIILFFIELRHN